MTNLQTGRSIIVKINDRGPFYEDRLIDLSWAAAQKLKVNGTAFVEVEALAPHAAPNPEAKVFTYYLQVAAFKTQSRALRLQKQLRQTFRGKPIIIKKVNRFYRVRIGPLTDLETVKQLDGKLQQKGFGKPVIIKS